jgi:surface protein
MTVLRANNAPVGLNKGKPNRASNQGVVLPWVRPSDWITFTTPTSSEQKVIGSVAVFNQDANYIALACTTTDASTYTVDWGDGTSASFASGTTAEKNYTYSSISSSTLSTRGYRQAIVTVTPTNSGATFSAVNLDRRNAAITSGSNQTSNPWLDIAVSAPNATTIAFVVSTANVTTARLQLCEQVTIVSQSITNATYLFSNMRSLQSVIISNNTTITNATNMFSTCSSLQIAPFFDTASITNMTSMFSNCPMLQFVPLYNTVNVTLMDTMFSSCIALQTVSLFNTANVTSMTSMFQSCTSLQTVPSFNTASVTNMTSMFQSCTSLQTVPSFNTVSVTNMTSMFQSCTALQNVALLNTASVTNMTSMFSQCSSLQSVPLFNTASVSNMTSIFSQCSSLITVPLFNTVSVTNMTNMFINCTSLQSVPLFNTAIVTNMTQMFNGCSTLKFVPLFNTASVTSMNSMFGSCQSLQTVPLFNTTSVTNMTSMFFACGALQTVPELTLSNISSAANNNLALSLTSVCLGQIKLTGNRWTQSFSSCRLGATQLDEMYTALAVLNPNVTNVTSTGTVVTYTVDDIRAFVANRTVTTTGIDPVAYNLTGRNVNSPTPTTGNAGTFTVTSTATGTYVSGGVATLQDNKTITVTSNPGTATDTPSIATNKGWTVTGS